MSELAALQTLLAEHYSQRPAPLHAPCLDEEDAQAVAECVRSGFVSSVGQQVRAFEQAVAAFTGAKHAVAVVNGTAALMLALKVVGVQPGDLVVTQSLTFIATANAIRHVGAEPLFLDVDDTYGLSAEAFEALLSEACEGTIHKATGKRISAIVPMHTLGFMADMPRICALAEQNGIPVVEDAAEALGSTLQGRHAGTWGRAGVLSFNGNKLITTGGGGMLLTEDAQLAEHARHLSTTAKQPHPYEFIHDETGYNLRLPNLNAALGLSQLKKAPNLLKYKQNQHFSLREKIASLKKGGDPSYPILESPLPAHAPNYWLHALHMPDRITRDALLAWGQQVGIHMRPFWKPLHLQPPYQHAAHSGDLSMSEQLYSTCVCLPSGKPCSYG